MQFGEKFVSSTGYILQVMRQHLGEQLKSLEISQSIDHNFGQPVSYLKFVRVISSDVLLGDDFKLGDLKGDDQLPKLITKMTQQRNVKVEATGDMVFEYHVHLGNVDDFAKQLEKELYETYSKHFDKEMDKLLSE